MLFLLTLLVAGGVAVYVMTPAERVRLLRRVIDAARPVAGAVAVRAEERPFHDALRARTSMTIVTPVLVLLNVLLFARMLFGSGALSDPGTLVFWGGNYAPRTTNGEWWRLLGSMFVHGGFVELFVNMMGLLAVGLVLERLVGHVTFAVVYIAAGIAASLACLFAYPLAVNVGATSAVLGVYGLLLAASLWSILHRTTLTIPLAMAKRIAPGAALFVFYALATRGLENVANLAGLAVGFSFGLVLTKGVSDSKPPVRRAAVAMAATVAIALVCSVPLRGISDAAPQIEQVVAAEDRTATVYQHAVEQFVRGRATAGELSTLIDRTILPDLQKAGARLQALGKVANEQRLLLSDAANYMRLRVESWRLRAEGLRKGNMKTLREAERLERASLEAFERIRPENRK